MLKNILYWIFQWIMYVLIIVIGGAALGFLSVLLLGFFFDFDEKGLQLWLHGANVGARYVGLWAGGLAIVLCFIKGYRTKHRTEK